MGAHFVEMSAELREGRGIRVRENLMAADRLVRAMLVMGWSIDVVVGLQERMVLSSGMICKFDSHPLSA